MKLITLVLLSALALAQQPISGPVAGGGGGGGGGSPAGSTGDIQLYGTSTTFAAATGLKTRTSDGNNSIGVTSQYGGGVTPSSSALLQSDSVLDGTIRQVFAIDVGTLAANANNLSSLYIDNYDLIHNGSGTLGTLAGTFLGVLGGAAAGKITNAVGYETQLVNYNMSTTITNGASFQADSQTTGVGAFDNFYGFLSNVTGGANQWSFYGGGTAAIGLPSTTFSALVAYASRAEVYCSDCTVTSGVDNTCAASGTGANAVRVNGAWKCWQ